MSDSTEPLKKTPLNEVEKELGGKMVDFGGWELPVQFTGILDEHEAVRTNVGVFDVSHMGELLVKGPQALELLQRATSNDVSKLANGRIQYTGLLYPTGGFVDDILVYRVDADDYFLVVNASNTDKDFEWLQQQSEGMDASVENVSADYAQLAVQGPHAERVLQPMTDVAKPVMETAAACIICMRVAQLAVAVSNIIIVKRVCCFIDNLCRRR